jgi:LacI family transcriptional regulator, gluconate utilization system Gnt-I transcriptional repressor
MTERKPPRRALLRDVAQRADVSAMTVTRTLREPDKVSKATRARVEAAVRALRYTPDLNARGLASRKSGLVAAIVPLLTNSLIAEIVQGLSDALAEHDYQLLIGASGFDAKAEEALIREFLSRRVDAIYLTGTKRTPASIRMLRSARLPIVEGGNLHARPLDMEVGYSNASAASEITRLVLSRYDGPIGYIGAFPRDNDRARDRRKGFEAACAAAKRAVDPRHCIETKLDLVAGAAAMAQLAQVKPRPRAVFCSADALAVGALFECQRRGLAVPRAIAIAGFDDLDIAGQMLPAITTVRVPRYEIGRRAGMLLCDRLAGRRVAARIVDVGYRLIERDSA